MEQTRPHDIQLTFEAGSINTIITGVNIRGTGIHLTTGNRHGRQSRDGNDRRDGKNHRRRGEQHRRTTGGSVLWRHGRGKKVSQDNRRDAAERDT